MKRSGCGDLRIALLLCKQLRVAAHENCDEFQCSSEHLTFNSPNVLNPNIASCCILKLLCILNNFDAAEPHTKIYGHQLLYNPIFAPQLQ